MIPAKRAVPNSPKSVRKTAKKRSDERKDRPISPPWFPLLEILLPAPVDLDYGVLERPVSSPSPPSGARSRDLRSTLTSDDRENISFSIPINGFVYSLSSVKAAITIDRAWCVRHSSRSIFYLRKSCVIV